jgi:hypothetical protein
MKGWKGFEREYRKHEGWWEGVEREGKRFQGVGSKRATGEGLCLECGGTICGGREEFEREGYLSNYFSLHNKYLSNKPALLPPYKYNLPPGKIAITRALLAILAY